MKLDIGLLILRLFAGLSMLLAHGWGKLANFSAIVPKFPAMLGIPSKVVLAIAVFAELFCALFLSAGFLTRLSAIPLAITMFMAAFVAHGADPYKGKEKALLYLIMYVTLAFTGGGKFAVDQFIKRK